MMIMMIIKITIQVDEFTGKLWEVYEKVRQEGGPTQVRSTCMIVLEER